MRELCETRQKSEIPWNDLLPNVRHLLGLLYLTSAVIDEKYVLSESDWGLNFLNYSLEAPLRANSFPAEAASG